MIVTINDLMGLNTMREYQEVEIWEANKEEYLFKGEYCDIPSVLDYCEILSFEVYSEISKYENINTIICFNVESKEN